MTSFVAYIPVSASDTQVEHNASQDRGEFRSIQQISNERLSGDLSRTSLAAHEASHYLQEAADRGYDTNSLPHSYRTVSHKQSNITTFSDSLELQHLTKPHTPTPLQLRPRLLRHIIHTWKWEISIWLLGTVGFLANIILMWASDGTFQRKWHSDIQITAFVAAFAQISQSAFLVPIASSIGQLKWKWVSASKRQAIDIGRFDLASRGPDGSMRLLWHTAGEQ